MARKRSCNINIPLDLTLEILKKLPTKSLARFQCVSKQWISIIREFIVINSILTRSLNQPPRNSHFIFNRLSISSKIFSYVLSYAYPHQTTNEDQLYCDEFFGKHNRDKTSIQYVRGLIGVWSLYCDRFTIYNPTTKQSVSLPVHRHLPPRRFYLFGYDLLKNQYKVLCLAKNKNHPDMLRCQVFTLGDPKKEWRNIQCGIGYHFPFGNVICINGVIYYKARTTNQSYVLVSFDVRSQKFKHVQVTPDNRPVKTGDSTLLNYQGKLAFICGNNKDVDLWVMENVEKQEWLKTTFFELLQGLTGCYRFADVTHPGGEIVIVQNNNKILDNKLDVCYYDPQRNIRRKIEIQTTTLSERIRLSGFVAIWAVTDHVENIMCL